MIDPAGHDTMPTNDHDADDMMPMTQEEYAQIIAEIAEQPAWRRVADMEMDYADGNQLGGDLLQKMRELGIPPAIENTIGPALLSIQGYEATIRTDWRVTSHDGQNDQDIADALNYRLNEAERESRADRGCSEAFRTQIACGIGWLEVARESDPFKYPFRCTPIHRNEIHWDMTAREADLSDARWLRRTRWLRPERVQQAFPQHSELIRLIGRHGATWWSEPGIAGAGGLSTGLQNSWDEARAWTIQENYWYNSTTKEVCLAELWYRRWVSVPVLRLQDGRVVELDEDNPAHQVAVITGRAEVTMASVTRLNRSYWLGGHCLFDGPTPYAHRHFPYVPFWGFREDSTGTPYGYVRSMKYAQDSLNSGLSKLRWGMSVTRVERTKGAVAMTDDQLRSQVARPDADVVLDAMHMAQPGARFEVKRDYNLTEQHYQMLNDARATIERVSNITSGFVGRKGTATSGLQEQTQVEQSNQSLGRIMDNFRDARRQVGELLLAMIIADIGSKPVKINIEGDAIRPDRTVMLNQPETDEFGFAYLSNDLQRTRLKVTLEDVPSTNSYRGQQLNAMSEAIKSLPAQYQAAVLPFMVSLMDVPFKREVVEAIRGASQQQTPEQIQQQIDQAVKDALARAGNEIKQREVDIRERESASIIKEREAKAVQIGVQAAFAAMQAGSQVAQMPMIAPIADEVMKSAGYQRPSPAGVDPNYPQPGGQAALDVRHPHIEGQGAQAGSEHLPMMQARQNTSPQFPPVPQQPEAGMQGIETPSMADNAGG